MTDQELRTQLWDYVYGLMEPAEAAALEVRIKSDPRLARMYAETRLEADLLAGAARLEHAPIPLTTRVAPAAATTQKFRALRPSARAAWANWVAGLAAVLLIGLFAYGWRPQATVAVAPSDADGVQVQPQTFDVPQQKHSGPIFAEISGPKKAPEGLSNEFAIQTRDARNAPTSEKLNFQVVDATGRVDFERQVTTDEKGEAKVHVPGAYMRENRRMVVKAKDQAADMPPVEAALNVVADQYQAHLEVDREISQPGQTVFFRAVLLGENSRVESAPKDAEFALVDSAGNPVPGSATKITTDEHGVAAGDFVIPSNAREGQYEVLVRSPRQEFDDQRIAVQVQRDGTIAGLGAATTQSGSVVARGAMSKLAMNQARAEDKFKRIDGQATLADSVNAAPAASSLEGKAANKPGAPALAANTPAPPPAPRVSEAIDAPAPAPPFGAPLPKPALQPAPGVLSPEAPAAPSADLQVEPNSKELAQGGLKPGANPSGSGLRSNGEKKLAEQAGGYAPNGGPNAATFGAARAGKYGVAPSEGGGGAGGGVAGGTGGGTGINGVADGRNRLRVESQKEGLVLTLPADEVGKKYHVEVKRGDETIVEKDALAAADRKSVGNKRRDNAGGLGDDRSKVVVPLAPEIGGPLRVELADEEKNVRYSDEVYREPPLGLIVNLGEAPPAFAPGQDVSLLVKTKTEAGDDVSAVLGVRVVNTDFTSHANGVRQALAGDKADRDENWAEAQRAAQPRSASDPAGPSPPADAAVDGLAHAKSERSFANGAALAGQALEADRRSEYWDDMNSVQVTLGSNRDLVRELVRDRLEKFIETHEKDAAFVEEPTPASQVKNATEVVATDVRPLGKRLLVGGLLGLVAIGVMFVVRVPVRAWAWGPALVAATACLVLGIVRLAPPARVDLVAERTTKEEAAKNDLKQLGVPPAATQPPEEPQSGSAPGNEIAFGARVAEREALKETETRKGEARGRDEAEGAKFEELAKNQLAERGDRERPMAKAAKDGGDAARGLAAGPAAAAAKAGEAGGDAPSEKAEKASELKKQLADVKQQQGETMRRKGAADVSPAVPPATLLWNPRLVTDENGEARINFRLPEQPGRYRVVVQGHANGRLGVAEFDIQTQPPVVSATPAEPAAPPAAKPAADAAGRPEPEAPAKPQPPVESKE